VITYLLEGFYVIPIRQSLAIAMGRAASTECARLGGLYSTFHCILKQQTACSLENRLEAAITQ